MTMTDTENQSDIIDISPEDIVEHKVDDKMTTPKPMRRRAQVGVAALLVAASAVGGGWIYRDLLASYLPSDQTQALAARIKMLEDTSKVQGDKLEAVVGFTDEIKSQLGAALSAAEEAKKQSGDLMLESKTTKNNIAALEKSLLAATATVDDLKSKMINSQTPQLSSGVDASGLTGRVDSLEKDVASLKAAGGTAKADTALLSQSLADLKAKIASGAAYPDEVDRIGRMVPAAAGLDILKAQAALGLPTAQGLSAELKAIIPALPKADTAVPTQDDSWWGSAVTMMSGLVTIKTVGIADWQQLATECAGLAEQGDLQKAVSTLEQTEGALPVELQAWHDRAASRLNLEHALEETSGAVLREIAAKG
jgi:hypothetical protein